MLGTQHQHQHQRQQYGDGSTIFGGATMREETTATMLLSSDERSERILSEAAAAAAAAIPPEVSICFLFFALVLGVVVTYFLSRRAQNLPYTMVQFVFGILIAQVYSKFGILGGSIDQWLHISPHLILFMFLPALLFGEAMSLKIYYIKNTFSSAAVLAGPGAVFGAYALAFLCAYILPYNFSSHLLLVLGSILCATDPVAVVSLLKSVKASPNLTMLITAESLLNDGSALVLYNLFFSSLIPHAENPTGMYVFVYFVRVIFISPLLGAGFGLLTTYGFSVVNRKSKPDDVTMQVVLTLSCAYLSFFVGENVVKVSGVLTCCSAGVFISWLGTPLVLAPHSMHNIWSTIEWIGNSLIFLLAGLLFGYHITEMERIEFAMIVVVYLLLHVIRIVMVLVAIPLYPIFGHEEKLNYYYHNSYFARAWKALTNPNLAFLAFGGLRGAVSIALALALYESSLIPGNVTCSPKDGRVLFSLVGGVAFLTLFVNATLSHGLLVKLGLVVVSSEEIETVRHYARKRIFQKLITKIAKLDNVYKGVYSEDILLDVKEQLYNDSLQMDREFSVAAKGSVAHGDLALSNEDHMRGAFINSFKAPIAASTRMRRQSLDQSMIIMRRNSNTGVSSGGGGGNQVMLQSASNQPGENHGHSVTTLTATAGDRLASSSSIATATATATVAMLDAYPSTPIREIRQQRIQQADVGAPVDKLEVDKLGEANAKNNLMRAGNSEISSNDCDEDLSSSSSSSSSGYSSNDSGEAPTGIRLKMSSLKKNKEGRKRSSDSNNNNSSNYLPLTSGNLLKHKESPLVGNSSTSPTRTILNQKLMIEVRVSFLEVLRSVYWRHITQNFFPRNTTTASTLLNSVDFAQDNVAEDGFKDWEVIESYLSDDKKWLMLFADFIDSIIAFVHRCLNYSKLLFASCLSKTNNVPSPSSSSFQDNYISPSLTIREMLEESHTNNSIYLLTSFIEASHEAQRKIPYYMGDTSSADTPEEKLVLEESEENVKIAKEILENIGSDIKVKCLVRQTERFINWKQEKIIETFQEEGIILPRDAEALLEESLFLHAKDKKSHEWLQTLL